MQCPVCSNTQLVMSERQGIEIDYCPQCRGVWLDRGELDKIIERAAPATSAPPPGFGRQPAQGEPYRAPPQPYQPPPQQPPQQQYPQHGHYRDDYHKRKKKGFLGELFDFD
ncbi:MAG TPA: zf-TFIIB domain-containing protein [Noviherbaspirillum sp.]|jgi:Zn-finger nucleic acid-binding protein|uniref:TFIIB-type zinc ribbon-containing protein n=1 Tax=Noviherbaspirillum sp. TaxID=1926288 RepID=UPI002F95AE97